MEKTLPYSKVTEGTTFIHCLRQLRHFSLLLINTALKLAVTSANSKPWENKSLSVWEGGEEGKDIIDNVKGRQSGNGSKRPWHTGDTGSPRKHGAMKWQRAEWNAWSSFQHLKSKWKPMRIKKNLVILKTNSHSSWIKRDNCSLNEYKPKHFFPVPLTKV